MLRAAALLLQLTLWVATVHAFFPFIPDGHCPIDEHCGDLGGGSKRSDAGSESLAEGVTLELYRRPVGRHESTNEDPVARAASRFARKFGGQPHPPASGLEKRKNAYPISEPLAPTSSNSAGIYNYGPDYSYIIKAQIGSAKQPLLMLLDTGAANTWLMDSSCDTRACQLHNLFDSKASTTWKVDKTGFTIDYGSGRLTGVVGSDQASFAGLNIPRMPFGLADYVHDNFTHFAFDGILGLGMGPSPTGTFLEEVKQQKLLKSVVVSMSLNRGADGVNDGQVTFGGVDKAKFTGDITYHTIEKEQKDAGHWAIRMDGASFNGKSAGVKSMITYIDTGTSFVFAPPADLDALFALVPGSSSFQNNKYREYVVPCDTKTPIVLTFSGVKYEVSAKDWVLPKGDRCVSNFYGWEVYPGTGSWLLGDTFLKNVYSVFDADKMRIGFAAKAPPPAPTTGTAGGAAGTTVPTAGTSLAGDGTGRPVMPGSTGGDATEQPGSAETATGSDHAEGHTGVNAGGQLVGSVYAVAMGVAVGVAMMI